ncbi:MAG: hypothetical protein JJE52_03870 [Acidimicrobiia bacterium]|nr:hypothetical protein [Acidimicrobiia bacterium]
MQRVIDLHRDLTSGEVGAARSRFTALMWKAGEKAEGENLCHRFTWSEIRSPVLTDKHVVERGVLGTYDRLPGIPDGEHAEPMRDLYSVLWCFERIEAGRLGHALDSEMLGQLVAHHAVWWNELTGNLGADNDLPTIHLGSLRSLAKALRTPKLEDWARDDFGSR